MIYFPRERNLTSLSMSGVESIRKAIGRIGFLNHRYYGVMDKEFKELEFFVDNSMNVESGILGATHIFNRNRVYLSPLVALSLCWEVSGVPNNEVAMETVIHEMTHLFQMRWLGGVIFVVLNNPLFRFYTTERWANENGRQAFCRISEEYEYMRELNISDF